MLKVAEGRIEHTQCCAFSLDDATDVGMDGGTPVSENYKDRDNTFTGKINSVTIELKPFKSANAAEEQRVIREAHLHKHMAD